MASTNGKTKVEYSITEKQCNDIKNTLDALGRRTPRVKLTTILSGIASGGLEARQGKKVYKEMLFKDEFRHDMLSVEEEVELFEKLLRSPRMQSRFGQELEAIREEFYAKKVGVSELKAARRGGSNLMNLKEKSESGLVYPLLEFLLKRRDIRLGYDVRAGDDEVGDAEVGDDEVGDAEVGDAEVGPEEEARARRRRDDMRYAAVLSMACSNRSGEASGMQKALGMHLRGRGMKDTELEMLYRLGVSASLPTLSSLEKHKVNGGEEELYSGGEEANEELSEDDDVQMDNAEAMPEGTPNMKRTLPTKRGFEAVSN